MADSWKVSRKRYRIVGVQIFPPSSRKRFRILGVQILSYPYPDFISGFINKNS
jgi:hypothetical protein